MSGRGSANPGNSGENTGRVEGWVARAWGGAARAWNILREQGGADEGSPNTAPCSRRQLQGLVLDEAWPAIRFEAMEAEWRALERAQSQRPSSTLIEPPSDLI